jgi:two-component system, cell cycle sensor histidine kinase and response regulator CckA
MNEKKYKTEQANTIRKSFSQIKNREWGLLATAIVITLLLTAGIISYGIPAFRTISERPDVPQAQVLRGLVGLVLLFDLYSIYQQLQIQKMRNQLFEREELFRLISENAADMIAVVDANGKRLYNSPSYEKVLGYSPEELKRTSALEQIHPDDREKVSSAAAFALKHGRGQSIEYRMRDKAGQWRILESAASAVCNKNGEVEKLIIVNRDVSERRLLEKQFLQAQKMEAIGRLSGGMAHDFNNLLSVIIGYAELLEEETAASPDRRESVEQILKAGQRAASLIRQLLAFSRQQVLEPKILDVNAIVLDTQKMLSRLIGEDIELVTRLKSGISKVKVDQGQLEQAIINMAVNARDAMPDGGQLKIETDNFEMDSEAASKYQYPVQVGSYVRLRISDDGAGMSPETLARAFEPFFTTKEKGKGTGLGLAMIYGFVKQSGGYIDLTSELGVGTAISIYLPQMERDLEENKSVVISKQSFAGNGTILLVEDDGPLRKLTVRHLRSFGYLVLDAYDATSALAISDATAENIDLLLTDVVMPKCNGRALAQMLLERRPNLRVLFTSGYTGQTVGEGNILEENCHFLPKPYTRSSLAQKVREVFEAQLPVEVSE